MAGPSDTMCDVKPVRPQSNMMLRIFREVSKEQLNGMDNEVKDDVV